MSRTAAARTRIRWVIGCLAVALAVLTAAAVGAFVAQSASSSAAPFGGPPRDDHGGVASAADGLVTEADGVLPDGVTVFDDRYPGIADLDAELLEALRAAATDAAEVGVELVVASGWRSPEYQDQLLREAVSDYGSEAEAARWVATAETSAHVSGEAVDIDAVDAMAWLSEHGAAYGLCQVYDNEPWHYELRPQANAEGCPLRFADPTQDPRMQQ